MHSKKKKSYANIRSKPTGISASAIVQVSWLSSTQLLQSELALPLTRHNRWWPHGHNRSSHSHTHTPSIHSYTHKHIRNKSFTYYYYVMIRLCAPRNQVQPGAAVILHPISSHAVNANECCASHIHFTVARLIIWDASFTHCLVFSMSRAQSYFEWIPRRRRTAVWFSSRVRVRIVLLIWFV